MKELYLATKDLKSFSWEILLSELKAHEFDLNRMPHEVDNELSTPSKGMAFKATEVTVGNSSFNHSKLTRHELKEKMLPFLLGI